METIGKYRIIGELGEGGFGHVYKAEDPAIGNIVAIKVLNVQNDENMLRRFRAEAVTSAKLRHKNIVTIFDFDEQHGVPYLVMEYLDGRNLQHFVGRGNGVPAIEKLSVMLEVAEGLQYAHEHGVIHRDIKPANIMRVSDGSVKIMDFGIARLTQRSTSLTAVGYMVGTPEYMAPEQFMGETADAQVDVWAYGVVLYELLTGRNPFAGNTPGITIYRVTHEDPPPVCDLAPELPRSLNAVMRRLLAKKKVDRYPGMDDVRMDLSMVIQEFGEAQIAAMEQEAESLIRAGRYDEALAVAAGILKFDHRNARARQWRSELRDLIRRQKQESRIQTLIAEADEKITAQDFPTAVSRLQDILQIDPENNAARSRLVQITEGRERKTRAQRLLADARVELERQNFTGALGQATEAAQADPANPEAVELLERIRQAIEKENASRRQSALYRARGQTLVQDHAGALATLRELEKHYPNDSEIRSRLAEAERLHAATATEIAVPAAVSQGRDLLSKGKIQEAIDLLSRLTGEAGRDAQVLQLLSFARDQKERQRLAAEAREEQAKSVDGALQECRDLMDRERLEEAEARARELWKRNPSHPGVQQIIRDLGDRMRRTLATREQRIQNAADARSEAYVQRRGEVVELMRSGRIDDAVSRLQQLAIEFPGVPQVESDLRRALAHRDQVARKAAFARERESLQGLVNSREFEQAVYKTKELLAIFPQEPELVEILDRAREARDRAARREAYAERRKHYDELMRNRDYDSALAVMEGLAAEFPEQPELPEDLRLTRAARDSAHNKTYTQGGGG